MPKKALALERFCSGFFVEIIDLFEPFAYDPLMSRKEIFLGVVVFLLVAIGLMSLTLGWVAWREADSERPSRSGSIVCSDPFLLSAFLKERFDALAFQRRKEEQVAQLKRESVFSRFSFVDHTVASQITFQNPATRVDQDLYHYDHIGAVAVADVNGDGLYDLFFSSLVGRNELWLNNGHGTFSLSPYNDVLALQGQSSSGVSFGDMNNDGQPDLIVNTIKHGIHLFENIGDGKFRDISENLGPLPLRHSSAATFFDFDNDGFLDVLISNVGSFTKDKQLPNGMFETRDEGFGGFFLPDREEGVFLLKNLGNARFVEVSKELGLKTHAWSGDVLVNDLNGDGFPDVYVLNMHGPNAFFLNEQGKHFVNATGQYFPLTPEGAMGGKFFDANNDGLADLFVTDMHADMDLKERPIGDVVREKRKLVPELYLARPQDQLNGWQKKIWGNAFFKNLGAGKFLEISDLINLENYWPWGVSAADVNADGYEDVFISSGMGYPMRYAISSLRLNSFGKKFVDAEFVTGIEPHRETTTEYFYLDCEGEHHANPRCVYCRDPTQRVDSSCAQKNAEGHLALRGATSDRSSVFVDLDNDGGLDLVISQFKGPPLVLLSDLPTKKKIHWLKLKLIGTRSNRDGLGAFVQLRLADGRSQFKWNDGKSGYLSQSSLPLYFGLGEVSKVKEIVIRWPSGELQKIEGAKVPTNQILEIKEP